jgi:hypothetical protein
VNLSQQLIHWAHGSCCQELDETGFSNGKTGYFSKTKMMQLFQSMGKLAIYSHFLN